MALVSPGVSLTVTDESQYVSSAIGTVPLVLLATAENKTINGSLASGTTAANANMLQVFTSQRDLTTALGTPTFQLTSAGTPINGDERNEYGLMAAYSALGVSNQLYAIRADIDLNALTGTSVRPTGSVADGTYWLDLADTTWGIYEWSSATQSYTDITPIVITTSADTQANTFTAYNYGGSSISISSEPTPLPSIGQIGSYAVVATTTNNRVFRKDTTNTWQLVGSTQWQQSISTVTGTVTATAFNANVSHTNTILSFTTKNATRANITISSNDTLANVATKINQGSITGIAADVNSNGYLEILASDTAAFANGAIIIDSVGHLANDLGIPYGSYAVPTIQFSNYTSVPTWTSVDTNPAPTNSVWFKSGAIGGGSNFVFKKYSSALGTWTTQAETAYTSEAAAINGLDVGGGENIAAGTLYVYEDPNTVDGTTNNLGVATFKPYVRSAAGPLNVTGATPGSISTGHFTLTTTEPGTDVTTSYTITLTSGSVTGFVSAILAANIPNVTASVTTNSTITLSHLAGGTITLIKDAGQANIPYQAGFTSAVTGVTSYGGTDSTNTVRVLSGFAPLAYTYSFETPTADPATGTLWYYSDATVVDIMVNNGTSWKGYQNVTADARGYNLSATDPMGVIVTASAPTTQTDGSALVAGDVWLDTSDLENWPKLNRYNGTSWIAIDNTDQVSSNGIVFADARWDTSGTTEPVSDNETSIVSLLTSNYLDIDAPNPRLYPRGTLLFNTRRSGYNVKRFVYDYFNTTTFAFDDYSATQAYVAGNKVLYGSTVYVAIASTTGHAPTNTSYWTALQTASWVTSSGLKADGSPYAGHNAQRQLVVQALRSAIDSNTEIREDQFNFTLIATPGYPELISDMIALNNDRANTAFIIGDTPMSLTTDGIAITNWSNDTNGTGLATNDPYCAVYYPSALSSDLAGNTIMVPPSHMALRTYLHNDNLAYPWFAPAGLRRGLVDNATDLGYLDTTTGEFVRTGVPQGLRDTLYTNKINPVTILPGTGIVVWGQKTRDPITESMDRVNVSRLVNYVRALLATSTYGFLFEPNDKITRDQVGAVVSSALNDLVSKRGIYDYVVVCDTSNNTPDRIANNQLYIDIAIAPTKAIEFIYIPIRLVNPGTGAAGA